MAQLLRYRLPFLVGTCLLWLLIHASNVLFGPLDKGIFDALAGSVDARFSAWTYLWLSVGLHVFRIGVFFGAIYMWARYWHEIVLLLRHNLLAWLLTAPRARRLPDSPSEAVTRLRDDVNDIAEYVEYFVDSWGLFVFALVALAIMLNIDVLMTVLILLPLLFSVLLARILQPHIRSVRRSLRAATGRVTDFIGEMMASVQAIKIAGREGSAMAHFDRLGEVRRKAALRDSLLTESFRSVSDNMISVSTGIMLILASTRMTAGAFTVGDFALFMSYLPMLTLTMTFIGNMLVHHRRTGVAFERLDRLMVDAPAGALVANADLQLAGPVPGFEPVAPPRVPLDRFEVRGLTYRFPDGQAGIRDVSFSLPRGSLTVITGRVGAGKSTLLRVLLGLIPADSGEILWNGERVDDPASFLVPPHTAYTSQVPRLFSDTLRENLVLGRRIGPGTIGGALDLAVFRYDVERLDHGLETQVGNRGVKLSGGQVQRSAATRMFLRDAELLVFDDLSSALDVETEAKLWAGIRARGDATCLVVSHRRALLERADQVLLMEGGQIRAAGTLAEVEARAGAAAGVLAAGG